MGLKVVCVFLLYIRPPFLNKDVICSMEQGVTDLPTC